MLCEDARELRRSWGEDPSGLLMQPYDAKSTLDVSISSLPLQPRSMLDSATILSPFSAELTGNEPAPRIAPPQV